MNQILVIGSSNTDMVIKTDKLPCPGETIVGGTFMPISHSYSHQFRTKFDY